jgi:hypothetical protein
MLNSFLGHHGTGLMLLKKSSKPAHQGFKRKKLDVMGSFAEIKTKLGQAPLPGGSRMPGVSSGNQSR